MAAFQYKQYCFLRGWTSFSMSEHIDGRCLLEFEAVAISGDLGCRYRLLLICYDLGCIYRLSIIHCRYKLSIIAYFGYNVFYIESGQFGHYIA